MNDRQSKPVDSSLAEPEPLVRARELRHGLLRLHKTLLDAERSAYEQEHGKVSSGEMLGLVIGDPQFAWLHAISELIVRIDEMFDVDDGPSAELAEKLLGEAGELLRPAEDGAEFGRKYFAALQADPDAVLMHRDISKLLTPKS
jgi:hypothetical protein